MWNPENTTTSRQYTWDRIQRELSACTEARISGFNGRRRGIIDTLTRTHGCFADYIQAVADNGEIFGDMDGKGVFLYATRGAKDAFGTNYSVPTASGWKISIC